MLKGDAAVYSSRDGCGDHITPAKTDKDKMDGPISENQGYTDQRIGAWLQEGPRGPRPIHPEKKF